MAETPEDLTSQAARPAAEGKVGRLATQTRGLADDVRAWVELKLELTRMEFEEKIDEKINIAIVSAVTAMLALLVAVFGLIAASFGLGELLGHTGWGFLATTGFLILVLAVLRLLKPTLTRSRRASGPGERPSAETKRLKNNA